MEWRACPNEARAEAADNMAATKDKELRLLYEQKAWGQQEKETPTLPTVFDVRCTRQIEKRGCLGEIIGRQQQVKKQEFKLRNEQGWGS